MAAKISTPFALVKIANVNENRALNARMMQSLSSMLLTKYRTNIDMAGNIDAMRVPRKCAIALILESS